MSKKYVLELTAEELLRLPNNALRELDGVTLDRISELRGQVMADREADELRLPWGVFEAYAHDPKYVVNINFGWKPGDPPGPPTGQYTLRQACLMSAADEWKQAALRAEQDLPAYADTARMLIAKAKRKEATGVPE